MFFSEDRKTMPSNEMKRKMSMLVEKSEHNIVDCRITLLLNPNSNWLLLEVIPTLSPKEMQNTQVNHLDK